MRSEHEWLSFLALLEEDPRDPAATGKGRLLHPREEIMVPTPERRATTVKAEVDDRILSAVSLPAADEILAYQSIDAAHGLQAPLMVIVVEGDATTPTRPRAGQLRGGRRSACTRHAAQHHPLRRLRQVLGFALHRPRSAADVIALLDEDRLAYSGVLVALDATLLLRGMGKHVVAANSLALQPAGIDELADLARKSLTDWSEIDWSITR
jgi:hypothetical protein